MRLYLESLDLFVQADGTAEIPAENADAQVRQKISFKLEKSLDVYTNYTLAIERVYQIHSRDTTTAKGTWGTLKKQFACESFLQGTFETTIIIFS